MAQSGYTPILIYASGTASNVPLAANMTSSASGAELALNYADGKLYYKNSSGVVTLLAGAGGSGPAGGSNTQVQYNNAGILSGAANMLYTPSALSLAQNLLFTDNTYDIGASGATRPRNLYLAGNEVVGGTLGVTGLATFSADNTAAIFQGATQGSITVQKTATSGYAIFSNAAGVLRLYNNNSSVTTAGFTSTGMIVGASVGSEAPAADLNIYNGNANGELLRMEGLGGRSNWNGFSFKTAGVSNRNTQFLQNGTTFSISQYETSTGNYASDGIFNVNTNSFLLSNYNTATQYMRMDTGKFIFGAGTASGSQVLTTPGISISDGGSGTSMSIVPADGLSGPTDARLLFGNGSSTYGALRMVFNSTANVSLDAVTWGNTGTTKDLIINANGGSVGVGIQSPSTYGKLAVGTGAISLVTDTGSQRRLSFWSTANGNSENAYIQVQNDGATTNTGEILFATRNSGGTLAERGRFTAEGIWQVTGASGVTTVKEYNTTRWSLSSSSPEGANYQRFKVTINTTRVSAICRIRAIINPDAGIAYQQGAEMLVSVARIDGGAVANILSVQSSQQLSLSEPQTSGNDVLFGFITGYNGTGTTPSVQIVVDYLSAAPTYFAWAAVSGTTTAGTSTQGLMKFNPAQDITKSVVLSGYGVGLGNTAGTSGTGISFPATQSKSTDANTLDDYEEGSWTPIYQTQNNDISGVSFSTQTGRYVKIGRNVTVTFSISTINAASASGTGIVQIRSLPFAMDMSNGLPVSCTTTDNRFLTNPFCGFCDAATPTYIWLYKTQVMNSANGLTVADFNKTNIGNYNLACGTFSYQTND